MSHVVLLGDSIFDNERYVPGESPIIEQLRSRLPREWQATLLARDGAVASDVLGQLDRLPENATHLIVSAGGNNALENSAILGEWDRSAAEGFITLAEIQDQFRREYHELLRTILAFNKPTVICTIYDCIPDLPPQEITALSVFNDVILREAIRARLPILDLRMICDEARDYSKVSSIEPSKFGGLKIVQGIVRIINGHDFNRREGVVYGK
jgi:hypothetical protein